MMVESHQNKETYHVPGPTGSEKVVQSEKGKESPADKMKRSYYDGLEVEAFRHGAGMTKDDKGGKETGGMPADVAQIIIATVNAQSTALTELMTKMVEMQGSGKGSGDGEQNQFMAYLVGEVKDMKSKLEGAPQDPLEVIEETSKRIDSLTDTMRKRMGIPETMAAGASGIESMKLTLELQNMKDQSQERQNQFELALKTMERQWRKEDMRWGADFKLRAEESRRSNANREQAITALQDLASSVIESIEIEASPTSTGGSAPAAGKPQETEKAEPSNIPTSITCTSCGTTVAVEKGKLEGTCPDCQTEFDLRPTE